MGNDAVGLSSPAAEGSQGAGEGIDFGEGAFDGDLPPKDIVGRDYDYKPAAAVRADKLRLIPGNTAWTTTEDSKP